MVAVVLKNAPSGGKHDFITSKSNFDKIKKPPPPPKKKNHRTERKKKDVEN